MVEYSGYISVNPVDWGQAAREAGQQIVDVIKKREEEKKQLDELNNLTQQEIAAYEATKSPEANEFIMAGSQTARSFIQLQNQLLKQGDVTPEEYKRRIQNTQVGFKGFKYVMDGFANNIEEARKLMEEGVTGKQADFINGINAKMLSLKDKMMTVGSNGNLYIKDAATGELHDIQSVTAQQNRVVKKVNLIEEVDNVVKGLGAGARFSGGKFELSARVKSGWNKTKKELAMSIISDPTKAASVLADNGAGYEFTDREERADNEILMVRDENRIWTPVLTEQQYKLALDIVTDQIESRVKYTAQQVSPRGGGESTGSRKYSSADVQNRLNILNSIKSKGGRSQEFDLIRGAQLPIQTRIGSKGEATYSGYVIDDAIPSGSDNNYTVVLRDADGNTKNINMSSDELFKAANDIINVDKAEADIPTSELMGRSTTGKGKIKLY